MLPLLRYKNSINQYNITSFGGINTSYFKKTNELSYSKNMSSSLYPALSSEKGFEPHYSTDKIICAGGYFDTLYTIERDDADTGKFYLCANNKSKEYAEFKSKEEASKERRIEFMNGSALIMPDNILYNIESDTFQNADANQTVTEEGCQLKFAQESGSDADMPNPYNQWYSSYITSNSLVSHKASYTSKSGLRDFYHFALSNDFKEGDFVKIKMDVKPIEAVQNSAYREYVKKMAEGIVIRIKGLVKTSHTANSGTLHEVTAIEFDDGAMDMGGHDEVFVYGLSIERCIPDFVDTCTFENRMWATCKNEIRSSKLGDFTVWEDFTVDSYGTLPSSCFRTGVDSDGDFCAITDFGGNILAFKEDCIYKLYGNEPSNYYLSRINCAGVKKGCHNTIKTVNGRLYYMGKNGIYSFNGTSATLISSPLNIESYNARSASGNSRFYFIEMYNETEVIIFVYDTLYGVWHKTDAPDGIVQILSENDELFFLCQSSVLKKSSVASGKWSFALSFGKKEFSSKHISYVNVRYSLSNGGKFYISVKNKHGTRRLCQAKGDADNKIQSINMPVSCSEDWELIFEGNGDFVLTSVSIGYKETGIKD